MKWLKSVDDGQIEMEIFECQCGYHLGVDSTYLQQVDDIRTACPSCDRIIDSQSLMKEGVDEHWIAEVCRTTHVMKQIYVAAPTKQEAENAAVTKAGNIVFGSSNDADYEVLAIGPVTEAEYLEQTT